MSLPATTRVIVAVCVASACWSRPADAQRRMQQPEMTKVEAVGTVDAVAPMMVRITTETNQVWIFKLTRETKVRVTGTAKPDFLRPGMYIVFKADVDRKGNSPTKLESLKIASTTIQEYFPPGVFPVAEAGFGGPAAPAANKDPNATTACEVRGMLTALKAGKATVNTGRGLIRVELAEEPQIDVDFSDLSVIQKGDKILIAGRAAREGLGEATEVTVELSQPLTLGEKAHARGHRPSRDRKKPDDNGKEEPKPGEGDKPSKPKEAEKPAAPKGEADASVRAPNPNAAKLVAMLQLDPETAATHKPIKLTIAGDEAAVFHFSKEEPLENLRQLLGRPDRTETIDGMMELPGETAPKRVTLTMLDCRGVQVFVDSKGIVRFYRVEQP